ncbi:hypothetical protein JZU57_00475, partial [bacterium]|nr:hypothetical protein [bacterium]
MAAAVVHTTTSATSSVVPVPRGKALPWRMAFLLVFHALLSGAFVVAWFSGDEDTYRIHLLAGYAALTAVVVRVAFGLATAKGPLSLPRPSSRTAVAEWLRDVLAGDRGAMGRRSPLLGWFAAALLVVVGLAGISGVAADFYPLFEDLHEALANLALWVVVAHVAL